MNFVNSIDLQKINERNAAIATAIGAALSIAGLQYKSHIDYWRFFDSCQEARQTRRDASRLLGKTIMSGFGGMSSEVTALIQDANDVIARCNAKGF